MRTFHADAGSCSRLTLEEIKGGGVWDPRFVNQKWPDQIFPHVNFMFTHDGHLGRGRGPKGGGGGLDPPPMVVGYRQNWSDSRGTTQ